MQTSPHITWYEKTAPEAPVFGALSASTDADVCVLGSGIVGISTALHLAEAGKRVVVLEPSRIGYGSSGRAGGIIESGLHVSMDEIADIIGNVSAHKFWQSSIDARNMLIRRIRENKINCGLHMGLFQLSNKAKLKEEMQHKAFYFSNTFENENVSYINERVLNQFGVENLVTGMRFAESGAFNPLTFLYELAELAEKANVIIYEKSPVESYKKTPSGVEILTSNGKVNATKLVVCGNAYMNELDSPEKTKTVSTEFFQLVTEPIDERYLNNILSGKEAMTDTSTLASYMHFTPDNRLIVGGPVKEFTKNENKFAEKIINKVAKTLPSLETVLTPAYLWKGPVGVPMNFMPVFAQTEKNIFTAHGFNGHGVSLAYMAGRVLSDACQGNDEMFELFSKIQQVKMPQMLQHFLAKFGLLLSRFENRIF